MVGFGGDLHGFIYGVIAVAWQQGFYSAAGWQAQGVERGAARKYLFSMVAVMPPKSLSTISSGRSKISTGVPAGQW